MNNRIVNTAKRATRIANTSMQAKALDAATVAAGLGARPTGYRLRNDTSPFTLYQMREELSRLLSSAGGRPSLTGMQDKVKIPRFAQDWVKIEALANTAAVGMAFRPSPAHVAAVLLHEALERFSDEELGQVLAQRMTA